MKPMVHHYEFHPGTNRHVFVMEDGIVLQIDHDALVACGTKEAFQEKMEKFYDHVRETAYGSPEPVPHVIPEAIVGGTGPTGGVEGESGGTGPADRALPTGPDTVYLLGSDELGAGGDVGC